MIEGIQALIIDLDGTMIDTIGDFEAALNRMLADFALPTVDRQFVEATVGKGSEHLVQSTLEFAKTRLVKSMPRAQGAIGSIAFEDALASYQKHYLACNGQASEVYPGVREGLHAVAALGLKMACLTNKPLAFAKPLLKAKGLDGFFGQIFGGDSFERKKPDPLPLLKTCEALGARPAQTLMIGDSTNDAYAAHAAGCPVVLVTYGYNHGRDIRTTPARAHLRSMTELPGVLRKYWC